MTRLHPPPARPHHRSMASQEGARPTSPRVVKFYFAYNSPYAFLANTRIAREVAPFDVTLRYHPVYSPRTTSSIDLDSPRVRYVFEDVARFAEAYGLDLDPGPFVDTRRACLAFLAAEAAGSGVGFHDGVFRARWLEGRDISDDSVLAGVAEAAGLDGEALLNGLETPALAAALDASNAEAAADGTFGVPTFVYGTKRFWGNDRIEWLVRELQKRAD
jgi:2-hydroxychromene-2-carboxylate isomerase